MDAFALLDTLPEDDIPAPGSLPAGSRMGLRANPLFVGREEEFQVLAQALKRGATVGIGQAASVTGLGGVGKTQLASEFVHRYGRYFAGGVFWLNFSEAANVPSEAAACGNGGTMIVRGDYAELPQAEQVALVRAAWDKDTPRLLVFDNCEDEALLAEWLPKAGSGSRVLLTSRRATWSRRVSVQTIPLGILPRLDSLALLAKFRPDLEGNPALDAIAEQLGDLPLALHLAGSYLERYQHIASGDPARYLEALKNPDLLAHPSMQGRGSEWSPTNHELHVARTFALSTDRLAASDAFADHLALALLARAAHFAPAEPIPRPLLVATLERPNSEEIELENDDAIWRLLELGLVEQGEAGALTLHRLVALFAKERNGEPLLDAVERVVDEEATRLNEEGYPPAFRPLLPHLHHLADSAKVREDERTAGLSHNLGEMLSRRGEYGVARLYLENALAIREQVLGVIHFDTAQSLNNLGNLLQSQGEHELARDCLERALVIREQVLEPNDPAVAQSLNNLGALLHNQGNYKAAKFYYERALTMREKVLGPKHPDTAQSLNNLGTLLQSRGDYSTARPFLERALTIYEEVVGSNHPDTARSLNNLGALLQSQGNYAAAHPYLERALDIWEQALGPTHPDTATSLNNLGMVLNGQGHYEEARPYLERALNIYEQVLGPIHPDIATSLNNLGLLLKRQGNYTAARSYLERALAIREQALEPSHPDTATSLNNLGLLLHNQGDYSAACPYFERAWMIYKQVFGSNHPDTRRARDNLQRAVAALRKQKGPPKRR